MDRDAFGWKHVGGYLLRLLWPFIFRKISGKDLQKLKRILKKAKFWNMPKSNAFRIFFEISRSVVGFTEIGMVTG